MEPAFLTPVTRSSLGPARAAAISAGAGALGTGAATAVAGASVAGGVPLRRWASSATAISAFDQPDEAASAWPLAGAAAAALASLGARRARRRAPPTQRDLVTMAAAAKKKKKKGQAVKDAALAAAMAAMQKLEEETKNGTPKKKEKRLRDSPNTRPAASDDEGKTGKEEPAAAQPVAKTERERKPEKVAVKDHSRKEPAPAQPVAKTEPEKEPEKVAVKEEPAPAQPVAKTEPEKELEKVAVKEEPAPAEPVAKKEPEKEPEKVAEKEEPAPAEPVAKKEPDKEPEKVAEKELSSPPKEVNTSPEPAQEVHMENHAVAGADPAEKPPAKAGGGGSTADIFAAFAESDLLQGKPPKKDPKWVFKDDQADYQRKHTADVLTEMYQSRPQSPPPQVHLQGYKYVQVDDDTFDEDDEDSFQLYQANGHDDDEEVVERKKRRGESKVKLFSLNKGIASEDENNVSCGIENVSIRLGGRIILQDATWTVSTGDRLALVGANGCGKTTQLRILLGELEADAGSVRMSRPDLNLQCLSQSFVDELNLKNTLREELLNAVPEQNRILKGLARIQADLEGETDEAEKAKLLDEFGKLQDDAETYKVYGVEDRMEALISQVGFNDDDLDLKVGVFSGGWKVRIGLTKLFMTAPDVLVLDEPTNHLDLESVEWLEKFLIKQTLPMVFVSHDREFIERVATRTVDTVEGMTYEYNGGYRKFVIDRDLKFRKWHKAWLAQEKLLEEQRKFISKNKLNPALAQARKKKQTAIDELVNSDDYLEKPPRIAKQIAFEFPPITTRTRGPAFEMRGVTHGYGNKSDAVLFEKVKFSIGADDKVGIVGRNGAGKSTLLKLMMGWEEPSGGGEVKRNPDCKISYFTQHQADLLPPDQTVREVVMYGNELLLEQKEINEVLEKFRFKGKRLDAKVEVLSGGEKARLAIVRMMLTKADVLVFDEPTNHLDIPMKETLEYSIREFKGAVVVVSHDRWFLSQTCKRMLAIDNREVQDYQGDYRYYMDKNPAMAKTVKGRYLTGEEIQAVPGTAEEEERKARPAKKKIAWSSQRKMRRDEHLAEMFRK